MVREGMRGGVKEGAERVCKRIWDQALGSALGTNEKGETEAAARDRMSAVAAAPRGGVEIEWEVVAAGW
jgi:hypothetical protein